MSLNLVITCSKRKKAVVPDSLTLGAISKRGSLHQIGNRWIKALTNPRMTRYHAIDLYGGDHWATVRKIVDDFSDVTVWIASAGYGLITLDSEIVPYSATFASGQKDSVNHDQLADWWSILSRWEGPSPGTPRSIEELAMQDPETPLLIAVSAPYLRAMQYDIHNAIVHLSDPSLLSVLCVGSQDDSLLQSHLLPCDARLQSLVGGTLSSINSRLARKLIREHSGRFSYRALARRLRNWMDAQKPVSNPNREPMSDDEVREFVRQELIHNSDAKHSSLLQLLRSQGKACGQSRFSRLYHEVKENHHAD